MNDTTPLPEPPTNEPVSAPREHDAPTRKARVGTMFWGAIIGLCCAIIAQYALFPNWIPAPMWIAIVVLVLGLIFLVAGIAVVLRDTHRSNRVER